jgi:hypothetical protein
LNQQHFGQQNLHVIQQGVQQQPLGQKVRLGHLNRKLLANKDPIENTRVSRKKQQLKAFKQPKLDETYNDNTGGVAMVIDMY